MYYCQVKVEVRDRIAVVISEIIGRSGCHFLANFLWWHNQQAVRGLWCYRCLNVQRSWTSNSECTVTDGWTASGRHNKIRRWHQAQAMTSSTGNRQRPRNTAVKYCGAAPVKQRCTSTHSLNFTHSGTRSQWRSLSSGVTWSYLRASADRRAAALSRWRPTAHGPIHVLVVDNVGIWCTEYNSVEQWL